MTIDRNRLRAALGAPELAWLLQRLRTRYQRGQADRGVLRLARPTLQQRQACEKLLGRRPGAEGSLSIPIEQLERLVVEGQLAPSLRDAVAALTGPLIDQRESIRRERDAWAALFDRCRPQSQPGGEAVLDWYEHVQSSGLLGRLSGRQLDLAEQWLSQAVRVVAHLPAAGVTLAQLAAQHCGDSHALDVGQPVGTLTLRAAAALAGLEQWQSASARRKVWDAVGVICDELSAPVLTLNLPATGSSLTDDLLRRCAQAGEPCRVTARQLLRHAPRFGPDREAGAVVFVCENANVIAAAADALGARCQPMVCLDGQPTTAASLLLDLLTRAGITLRYHGDFDWGGVRIANRVMQLHQAQPWRMSAADYLEAAAQGGRELKGAPAIPIWDAGLGPAMQEQKIAVHEERLLPLLLEDLQPS